MNIRNHNNIKIIVPKELKLGKKTQKVIGKSITPKCQLKWDTFYEKQLSGNQFGIYWTKLNVSKALSSSNGNVCISLATQNIDYKKMGKSNSKYICKCHLCKNEIESLIHLFLIQVS